VRSRFAEYMGRLQPDVVASLSRNRLTVRRLIPGLLSIAIQLDLAVRVRQSLTVTEDEPSSRFTPHAANMGVTSSGRTS